MRDIFGPSENTMSDLKKIIKEETEKILHKQSRKSLKETKLSRLVKEEALAVLKEAKEKAPDIDKKLDEFRKKLIREGDITSVQRGMATSQTYARPVKRVSLEAVSKIIDVPINELLIHLLNTQRLQENQKCVYEYRGGMIDFFGELKEKTMLETKIPSVRNKVKATNREELKIDDSVQIPLLKKK